MSGSSRTITIVGIIFCGMIFFHFFLRKPDMMHALSIIKTSSDAIALFPASVAQMKSRTQQVLEQAQQDLKKIVEIPDDQRTYANTADALDKLVSFSNVSINASVDATVEMVHPDEAMRNAAHAAVLETQNFFIDNISANKELYRAFKAYVEGNAKKENLSDEQKRFLEETLDDFLRAGLGLAEEKLALVKDIKKELAELEMNFEKNIAQDQSKITVDAAGLAGLNADFINSLSKTQDGLYILSVDFPTYTQVMENCSNALTRKNLAQVYINRAYPANKEILQQVIAKRYELAQLLGFPTYAALELDNEMVKSPERALDFLNAINTRAQKKAAQEFNEFTQRLPESIEFTIDGKLYPWDVPFLKNQYKKTAFELDENKVAEYFPMQNTIDNLLKIYQQFFNLEFKQLPARGLWDADVRLIEVVDMHNAQTVGYLFMDLHPRPNKFSHACEHTMIPVTYDADGNLNLGVVIVIANFPKPRADKPSLLHLKDVNTFFHEFGHAMHALLGRTQVVSFAGTGVKRDFVEMPSQMLEEWLWNPAILKMISSHYQTGDALPDALINIILKSRTYDSGFFIVRQMYLAKMALSFFNNGASVNIDETFEKLFLECMYGIQFNPADHFYAAFGHLMGYGARYYGYIAKIAKHDTILLVL